MDTVCEKIIVTQRNITTPTTFVNIAFIDYFCLKDSRINTNIPNPIR